MSSDAMLVERRQKKEVLEARAKKVQAILALPKYAGLWEPYPFNAGYFMCLKLKGIDDRNAAESLRGKVLFVDEAHRAKLPEGEYFVHDVLGLAVREEGGTDLGTVADVLRYPASDVYVVRGDRGEILIPAVKEFVRSVDLGARTMTVRLIEGMIE